MTSLIRWQSLCFLLLLVASIASTGCKRRGEDYDKALAPGAVGIRMVDPKHWPNLTFPAANTPARKDYLFWASSAR